MANEADNDNSVPDDLSHLDSKTAGTVETIRNVYTHNAEQLEQHVAALVLKRPTRVLEEGRDSSDGTGTTGGGVRRRLLQVGHRRPVQVPRPDCPVECALNGNQRSPLHAARPTDFPVHPLLHVKRLQLLGRQLHRNRFRKGLASDQVPLVRAVLTVLLHQPRNWSMTTTTASPRCGGGAAAETG